MQTSWPVIMPGMPAFGPLATSGLWPGDNDMRSNLVARSLTASRRDRGLGAVAVTLVLALVAMPANAQIATTDPAPAANPGWSFAVTPYIWLPTVSATLKYDGPRGGTVTTTISEGIGDYLTDINFALMVGAEARYDRFTILTDLFYANLSVTTDNSRLASFNPGPGPIFIPREQQLSTGTRMATTIWSLAGGYTVLQGDWGNLDAVAGFRMLAVSSTTNYQLNTDILAPDRTIALSRGGSLDIGKTYFNAIGGVTGRINIPNSKFYLPFYFDAGGGDVPFTWQAYGGIAYSAASWADVAVGYRYLTFQNGAGTGVRNLSLGGAILVANFRF
jgi:hypothetical protein